MAGTLEFTGVTGIVATSVFNIARASGFLFISVICWLTFFGSSILDNVVLVAAFIPVIDSFRDTGMAVYPLWWALLFGGCIGGNLTIIGSTSNIVALGILEKKQNLSINFFEWLRVGFIVGIITMVVVWLLLLAISPFMPQNI